jgi:hypothetical protein
LLSWYFIIANLQGTYFIQGCCLGGYCLLCSLNCGYPLTPDERITTKFEDFLK